MTLIELFIALMILAVGITACLRIFNSAAMMRQNSRDGLHATGILNNLLFELETGEKSDWLTSHGRETLGAGEPFVSVGEVHLDARLLESPIPEEIRKVLEGAGLAPYYEAELFVDWRQGKRSVKLETIVKQVS